jgi:hypothetical protein
LQHHWRMDPALNDAGMTATVLSSHDAIYVDLGGGEMQFEDATPATGDGDWGQMLSADGTIQVLSATPFTTVTWIIRDDTRRNGGDGYAVAVSADADAEVSVPEPATMTLFAVGSGLLALARRCRSRHA